MIIGSESKPPLSELAHYGTKGMKWGVHKDGTAMTRTEKKQRIQELQRKMDPLDMNRALNGINLLGWTAAKVHKKAEKKDPKYDSSGKTWTNQQHNDFDRLIIRKAKNSARLNALKDGAIVGTAGLVALSALAAGGMHANTVAVGRQGIGILGTSAMIMRLGEIKSIDTAVKREDILNERIALENQLAKGGRTVRVSGRKTSSR